MDQHKLAEKLRTVNEEAAKIVKELQQADNPKVVEGLVHEFGNRMYLLGLNDGKNQS